MIWIAYPGITDDADARHVVVDGIHWDVMTWQAHNRTTDTSWRYVAYLAHRQRDSVSRLRLNPFFRDAERAGELSPRWYRPATAAAPGLSCYCGIARSRRSGSTRRDGQVVVTGSPLPGIGSVIVCTR